MDRREQTLEQYLGAVLRGAATILGCGSTNLVLLNEKTEEIRVRLGTMAVSYPMLVQIEQLLGRSFQEMTFSTRDAQDSLVYRSWRDRCILETSSVTELVGSAFPSSVIDALATFIGDHRFICVPALCGNHKYGVLLFQKEGGHPFNRQQREVLLRYARRIGEILENDVLGKELTLLGDEPEATPAYLVLDPVGEPVGAEQVPDVVSLPGPLPPAIPGEVLGPLQEAVRALAPPPRRQRLSLPCPEALGRWSAELIPLAMEGRSLVLCGVQPVGATAERSLENQLLHLTLGEAAPALFVDAAFCITSCNEATAQLLGYAPEELVSRPLAALFGEPEEIHHLLHHQMGDLSNPYCEETAVVRRKDGSLFPARVEVLFLADDQNQVVGFLVLLRGAPEARPLDPEEVLRNDRLSSMGELAAQLAHEIRNPLVAIGATLETLLREEGEQALDQEAHAALTAVSREIVRLDMSLRDYLAARHDLSFSEVCVGDLVEEARRLLEGAYRLAGKTICTEVEDGLTTRADHDALKHVLFNLLLNALEASPPRGEVMCKAAAGPHGTSILIEDRGPGLTAEPAQCFEPFFTTKPNGTGLGLAVCQKIARAHGGLVTLRNREGGGCRAVVSLPRHRARGEVT